MFKIVLLFWIFISGVKCKSYFATLPNVIRFDHEETVVVSVSGLNNARVKIWLQHGEKQFSIKDVVVRDEETPAKTTVKVTDNDLFGRKPRHISICLDYGGQKQCKKVLIYRTGNRMVQTDKPIHTPRIEVKVKTRALDESLRAVEGMDIVQNWYRLDEQPSTREHLLMALADLDSILIKATFRKPQVDTRLRDVSMDTAESRQTRQDRAYAVESCLCHVGYRGLSCEDCDTGYTRSGRGLFLGICEPCRCNGHSNECDPETGVCMNCQHNTEGDRCERCATGFYGDATSGTPNDCRACPCPLTTPQNQFSRTCYLAEDNQVTCESCPTGYSGRQCQVCAEGHIGDPSQPGGSCRRRDTDIQPDVVVSPVSEGADQAPTVRIEPRYQEVEEGTPVRFNCIATGEPTPRVKWYRGGSREMNPEATITNDGVFSIPRVRLEDESDYYCKATNDLGTAEVRTILYVTRGDRPDLTIIVRQTKYVSLVGETARLECYVEDASGKVTLFWSRATGLPPGSTQDNGILTIPDVQPSYAGNYVCTGTDRDTGRVSTAIAELEVEIIMPRETPTVRLEPEKITIPMGTTGTLRCQATGSPEPKVTWIKSRGELSPNHQVNGNVLRITQATMEDRGIYVCRAENEYGLDQDWTIVEVERRMRPKIDLYPNTTQRVAVGGRTLFQCRVMDGDPPPKITWTRVRGVPISSERVKIMDNGVIMFEDVTQAEQGGYICTVENDMGTITAAVTLIVEGPPTITLQPSQTVYALMGQRVTLECTADGDPIPSVYWIEPVRRSREDVLFEPGSYDVSAEYGTAIVDIASVEREDQGTYTCVASNRNGRTEERVQLVVREGESRGVSISGPRTLSVVEGQSVELVCTANELRNPLIRWRRREGTLPSGHSVRDGVLKLPRFRSEYAGEYICSTTVQQQSYEASVFIIVTVSSRLTISPQRIAVRAGNAFQLHCTASGSGPFNIEWSRIGDQMNPSATERDGILEIRQVTAADAGRYRCVVQSSAGTSDGYAIVEVEVPPAVVVAQRNVFTEENRIARLQCDASGSPPPVVRWEKEGDQLPPQHRIQDGVLTIYGVQEADAGRYICTASSSAGSSRDYAVLHVTTEGSIDTGGENVDTQIVNVGDRVFMECIVTGTPLPKITWSRDDGPLPAEAILGDGILIIPQARGEDAGTYTCLAVNELGSIRSKIVLYVKDTNIH